MVKAEPFSHEADTIKSYSHTTRPASLFFCSHDHSFDSEVGFSIGLIRRSKQSQQNGKLCAYVNARHHSQVKPITTNIVQHRSNAKLSSLVVFTLHISRKRHGDSRFSPLVAAFTGRSQALR